MTAPRTAPAHVVRPARRAHRKAEVVEVAHPGYEPGHFLALVKLHDWPPHFEPRMREMTAGERSKAAASARGREIASSTGAGWGTGCIVLPNTPHNLPPTMMRRRS